MIPLFIANIAIALNMQWSRLTYRRPFLRAIQDVQGAQDRLLRQILQENASTAYGRAHGFSKIATMADYRARVPIATYDALEPDVLQQQNGAPALTVEPPVYYARTSGTTGRYKDIPLTRYGVGQITHVQKQLALSLWLQTRLWDGVVLGFSSPGYEGYLPNGIPYGSTSGATYQSLSPIVKQKFGIPKEAFSLDDVEAKYEVYALVALARGNVTGVITVNPSSLLKVCTNIDQQHPDLLAALLHNDANGLREETRTLLPILQQTLTTKRREALERAATTGEKPSPSLIWPKLSTLVTWTGGSCGIALEKLARFLPKAVKVVEMGYASSEFIGTANIDVDRTRCLPLLTDNVYEFVTKNDWEADRPHFLGLHEIRLGEEYYIFITNRSGLYRYNINDVVRVTEGMGACPGLQFVRKGKGVTNITGEKLSEDQMISAVTAALKDVGETADTFIGLADEDAAQYRVHVELDAEAPLEPLADRIEANLRQRNGEYDDKRASGRLKPVQMVRLRPGTGQALKAKRLADGVRETQYKPPVLAYHSEWADWLHDWSESA